MNDKRDELRAGVEREAKRLREYCACIVLATAPGDCCDDDCAARWETLGHLTALLTEPNAGAAPVSHVIDAVLSVPSGHCGPDCHWKLVGGVDGPPRWEHVSNPAPGAAQDGGEPIAGWRLCDGYCGKPFDHAFDGSDGDRYCSQECKDRRRSGAMSGQDEKTPCWLVWQRADDGGRPYLVAVDTSEEQAAKHVKSITDEALMENKVAFVQVETSWLNHRYGESMGQGYDALKAMFHGVRGAR